MGYIYGLFDPDEPLLLWNCRYIGMTEATIEDRLKGHLEDVRKGLQSYRCNWIRSILERPHAPIPHIIALEEIQDREELLQREREWIAAGRSAGWRLTNGNDGGSGGRMGPEALAKMSAAKMGSEPWNKGKVGIYSEETRAKIREARAQQVFSEESKYKMGSGRRGKKNTPEHNAALVAANTGKVHTPETRAKISATLTGVPRGPMAQSTKDKISERHTGREFSEEWIENMREGANRRWEEPGAREAYSELMTEVMSDPEIRRRVSEGRRKQELLRDKSDCWCAICSEGPFAGRYGLTTHLRLRQNQAHRLFRLFEATELVFV